MIIKNIMYFGQHTHAVCDGKCEKAWGAHNRPRRQMSDDDDDFEFLSDEELDTAPANPGTYEDGYGKPDLPDYRLNKWCVRECERARIARDLQDFELPTFRRSGNV